MRPASLAEVPWVISGSAGQRRMPKTPNPALAARAHPAGLTGPSGAGGHAGMSRSRQADWKDGESKRVYYETLP